MLLCCCPAFSAGGSRTYPQQGPGSGPGRTTTTIDTQAPRCRYYGNEEPGGKPPASVVISNVGFLDNVFNDNCYLLHWDSSYSLA